MKNGKEDAYFISCATIRAIEGIEELREIITISDNKNMNTIIDFSLARGLSYYTSSIFEVIPKKNSIGSLAGGGRYDNLTEVFGL